jgi:hypothetical protein
MPPPSSRLKIIPRGKQQDAGRSADRLVLTGSLLGLHCVPEDGKILRCIVALAFRPYYTALPPRRSNQ